MKQMVKNELQLIHSAITHFIGVPIDEVNRIKDDSIMFKTHSGEIGFIEQNFVGNMDVWMGETVVYEIEKELFDVIEADKQDIGFIDFYNIVKEIDSSYFKKKSGVFIEYIKSSLENIILNYSLPMEGDTKIGPFEIHGISDMKIKINLN